MTLYFNKTGDVDIKICTMSSTNVSCLGNVPLMYLVSEVVDVVVWITTCK